MISPFDPHDPVPVGLVVLSWVLMTEVIPAPGEAEAVTFAVEGVGEVMLLPVGKFHCARVKPQKSVPALVVVRARLAVAVLLVSSELMKR